MKKIVLVVCAIATAFVLVSCANQGGTQTTAQPAPVKPCHCHHKHDLKGESN